jgi:dephospho-CoA kinase
MTVDKFNQMLARQLPDDKKRERADFVIETGKSLEETRSQVQTILACLGLPAAR